VLDRVFTLSDLLSCRLVSRIWKTLSSASCRRGYVHLNLKHRLVLQTELEILYSTFLDLNNLPWSSCTVFGVNSRLSPEVNPTLEELDKFFQVFGTHVRKLEYNGGHDLSLFISMLQQTPNLEILISEAQGRGSGIAFDKVSFQLKMLNRFELTIHHRDSLEFFTKVMSHSGVRLTTVVLTIGGEGEECVAEVSKLITNIPSITLNFHGFESSSVFIPFTNKNLKIRELMASLSTGDGSQRVLFRPLERLLADVSPYLEKFTFQCFRHLIPTASTRLNIPNLPKLKYLELSQSIFEVSRGGARSRSTATSFQFISPFKANQFPVLEDVYFRYSGNINLFNPVQFGTVYKAELEQYDQRNPMVDDWNRVFPNLRELQASVNKASLIYILTMMTKLEDLDLNITKCEGDVNALLTGIQNPEALHGAEAEIVKYRDTHHLPSLLSLTGMNRPVLKPMFWKGSEFVQSILLLGLRRLTLRFGTGNPLKESGINLALLQIQSLDYLCICLGDSTVRIKLNSCVLIIK